MENSTTTDLRDFGAREREMLQDLLKAWDLQGLPVDFYGDGVQAMFNKDSGNVFLTNSEYQIAMMNGDKLESFYYCPQCGHEGFLEDMEHGEGSKECQEYLESIKDTSEVK